eukprot:Phypoly_transcript_17019.p1 GENE.Phypoly_transcript_17019~~Phypoly_transcript_17019.p1  ORF type:complete len:210 (+),score=8.63 Phypoly_transcript_17019:62-631(+)
MSKNTLKIWISLSPYVAKLPLGGVVIDIALYLTHYLSPSLIRSKFHSYATITRFFHFHHLFFCSNAPYCATPLNALPLLLHLMYINSQDCLPPIKQKMNQQELNSIFSNIEVIRSFHHMLAVEFAQQLSLSSDKQKIGAIVIKYVLNSPLEICFHILTNDQGDFLKLYKPYCTAQGLPALLSMEKNQIS